MVFGIHMPFLPAGQLRQETASWCKAQELAYCWLFLHLKGPRTICEKFSASSSLIVEFTVWKSYLSRMIHSHMQSPQSTLSSQELAFLSLYTSLGELSFPVLSGLCLMCHCFLSACPMAMREMLLSVPLVREEVPGWWLRQRPQFWHPSYTTNIHALGCSNPGDCIPRVSISMGNHWYYTQPGMIGNEFKKESICKDVLRE